MQFRKWIIIVLCMCFLGMSENTHAQCAMCKKSAQNANANKQTQIASDLNTGVLYLLALPYLAGGVLAFVWYRNNRIQNA